MIGSGQFGRIRLDLDLVLLGRLFGGSNADSGYESGFSPGSNPKRSFLRGQDPDPAHFQPGSATPARRRVVRMREKVVGNKAEITSYIQYIIHCMPIFLEQPIYPI